MKEQEKEIKRVISYIRSCWDAGYDYTHRQGQEPLCSERFKRNLAVPSNRHRGKVSRVQRNFRKYKCVGHGCIAWCGQAIEKSEEDE